jgi:hypothetical protein
MNRVAFGILDSVVPEGFHGLAVEEERHCSHKTVGSNETYQFPVISQQILSSPMSLNVMAQELTDAHPQTPRVPATRTQS